jgi:hypothetical protein
LLELTKVFPELYSVIGEHILFLSKGLTPAEAQPVVFGARGVALAKKGGGIRPIACGDVFRRCSGKFLMGLVKIDMAKLLLEVGQIGVSVAGGGEAMTHAARRLVSSWGADDPKTLLKIDFVNAFNTVSRDHILAIVAEDCPQLLPYVLSAYGSASAIDFGEIIWSMCGAQQGDPLGPLFSLVLRRVWRDVEAALAAAGSAPLDLRAAFLDDKVLAGDTSVVRAAFVLLREKAAAVGLVVNLAKCEVISRDPAAAVSFADIPAHPAPEKWQLLGAPCGSEVAHAHEHVKAAMDRGLEKLGAIVQLPEAHIGMTLIGYCASFGLAVFYARAVGPSPSFKQFDAAVRDAAGSFIGHVSDDKWLQVRLARRLGGIGLRDVMSHAPIAFAVASASSQSLFSHLISAEPLAALPADPWLTASLADPILHTYPLVGSALTEYLQMGNACFGDKMQRELSHQIEGEHQRVLLLHASVETKARLLSCSAPHASSWISPTTANMHVPNFMTNAEFVVLIRNRLGLPVLPLATPCAMCKGRLVADVAGRHSLCCLGLGFRHRVHNALRKAIYGLAMRAHMTPKEESNCFTDAPTLRVDVLLQENCGPRPTAIDISVIFPLQPGLVHAAATKPGGASERQQAGKFAKYGALCESNGIRLCPLIVDTFGAWGPDALPLLRLMARTAASHEDETASLSIAIELQKLAFILQRGVARLLLANAGVAHAAVELATAASVAATLAGGGEDAEEEEDEEEGADDVAGDEERAGDEAAADDAADDEDDVRCPEAVGSDVETASLADRSNDGDDETTSGDDSYDDDDDEGADEEGASAAAAIAADASPTSRALNYNNDDDGACRPAAEGRGHAPP